MVRRGGRDMYGMCFCASSTHVSKSRPFDRLRAGYGAPRFVVVHPTSESMYGAPGDGYGAGDRVVSLDAYVSGRGFGSVER
jgi:hypothetical protein